MKKVLSVTLSVLMIALLLTPVLAAGTHTVTFVQPSGEYAGGYTFAKVENGAVQFAEDPNGIYVYYSDRYMTLNDIYENYWDEVPPERYSPVAFAATETFSDGEFLVFDVVTSPKYDQKTVTVMVNNTKLNRSDDGLFRVTVKSNLNIRVLEKDENGIMGLQRTMFNVKLASGEGFSAKMPAGESYKGTYYGDSFIFRVKVKKGYSASSMKVSVLRGVEAGMGYMEEFESVAGLLGYAEQLTSYSQDSEGCRLYKVENVTSDCHLIVTGVREEKKANIISMLLKVLRQILNFLGIKIQFVDDMTDEFTVNVNNTLASNGVAYNFLSGTANENGSLTVMSGNGAVLEVIKSDIDQKVKVSWAPGNETGEYATNWVGKRDKDTGNTIYVATYYIDNIKGDVSVNIELAE